MTTNSFTRACVVVPTVKDFYFTPHRFSCLGAYLVKAILENQGLTVDYLNFPIDRNKGRTIQLPAELNYLAPYIADRETGRFSFFTRYHQYGPDPEYCTAHILGSRPDICFISCFAFCYARETMDLIRSLKERQPDLPLVVGGAGVSCYPEYFLRAGADFAICNEAEVSLPAFLYTLQNKLPFSMVPNLYWKENDLIAGSSGRSFTADNNLSFALVKTHVTKKAVYYTTSLSRGCPKHCRFCSNHLTHGKSFRKVPLKLIQKYLNNFTIDENDYGKAIYVNFEDDNLLCESEYFKEILTVFREHIPEVLFSAENGIDFTLLTPDLCRTLYRYGFRQFNISIASTDFSILSREHRSFSSGHFESIIKTIAELKCQCITYFICGLEKDTLESTSGNLFYLSNLQTLIGISPFYPVPGLDGYTDKRRFDTIPPLLCAGSSAYPWNNSITTRTMITAFRLARYINVAKAPLNDLEKQVIDKTKVSKKLHTIVRNEDGTLGIIEVPDQDERLAGMFFNYPDHHV